MQAEKELGIQVARAVAAICIMYFHSWIALVRFPEGAALQIPILTKFGWLAVDFFFAISGYVICLVITKPGFQPIPFLIKRCFRIYPLWILTLTAFAAMALAWRAPMETETIGHFLRSMTLVPTQPLPFYGPGWSLQHEVAFYLLAALVVPIAGVNGLIVVLLVSTIAAHTIEMPWYVSQLALRHPEFLAGILAFLMAPRLRRLGVAFPLLLGMTLLWLLMRLANENCVAPALFFLVIAFVNIEKPPAALVAIGDASYSIYLTHMVTFFVISAFTSKVILPSWTAEPLRFLVMAAVVVMSFACWRLFERPLTRYGARLAAKYQQHQINLLPPTKATADRAGLDG
ncbi:acyltransferase family protein [Bradyrhizobium guangzhouense]|uniref:acyltransferase family protein n=1 Tax=Bradyrhizobium guangzhouense TaxID=1325095 RepID=UPI001009B1A2|nr:acyltransferase [Bradyrhizobium guangzhouense]RXH15219.1 acyltransferase [Bradyrhizobium guangzhouense]